MDILNARYLTRLSFRKFLRRGLSNSEMAEHSGRFVKDTDVALAFILDSPEGKENLALERAALRVLVSTPEGKAILAEERKALGLA